MYTRQEASQIRQEFWTIFGQYMAPVLSSEGEKVNWVNYKTGEKDISFRMEADNRMAFISIELSHKDPELQQLYFDQFKALELIWKNAVGDDWDWLPGLTGENGRIISRISKTVEPVNIFDKQCWPRLISFFKEHLLRLDRFWSEARYSFEALR